MKRPGQRFRGAARAAGVLLIRPERFFRMLVRFRAGSLPFVVIWVVGVAYVLSNFETRIMLAQAVGRPIPRGVYEWILLWPAMLIGGVVGGGIAWLIRGWWFRARLRFCGAGWVPGRRARLVWLYGETVWAVPSVMVLALATPLYRDYEAMSIAAPLAGTVSMLAFWSVFVAYRGAISCFPVKRNAALWWFLILPMSWYGLAFVGVLTASLIALF